MSVIFFGSPNFIWPLWFLTSMMKMSLADGVAAGVGAGEGVWPDATTDAHTIKQTRKAGDAVIFTVCMGLRIARIRALSKRTGPTFQVVRLRARRSLWDYWYVKSIIHNPNLVRST